MSNSNVLIIGAGAAGIACACRLLENGVDNLLILEGGNRIGGRIHTAEFGNSVVDFGAHWVHGETGNVVSDMAQKLDMLCDTVTDIISTQFVTSSGEWLDLEISLKYFGTMMEILTSRNEDLAAFDGSLGEFVIKEYWNELSKDSFTKLETLHTKFGKCYIEWFAKFQNSIDGSDSWFDTSARGHVEYKECEGNPLQSWKKGGYHNVLDILMKKVPDPENALPVEGRLLLNKEVVKIEWEGQDEGVRVSCRDGSVHAADHVVVTLGLGVLKERAAALFAPPLPPPKLRAIEGLAIGTVDKVYLRFPHRWWPDDVHGFSLLWTDTDRMGVGSAKDEKEWLTDVMGFYEVDLCPDVLCGWVVGPSARVMESLSDRDVSNGCLSLLRHFLGHRYEVPPPVEVAKSSWFLDPLFRGSYSFRSLDTDRRGAWPYQLARPLTNSSGCQNVLFAGEATHDHFFSTVHGAIETGWREADRILDLLRRRPSSKL